MAKLKKVYLNKGKPDQRTIGEIDTFNKVFYKKVWQSRHLFRALNAYGIDSDYFNAFLLKDNYEIVVSDQETGKVYQTTAKHFKEHGKYFHFKEPQTDHRTQLFLSLEDFKMPKKTEDQKYQDFSKQVL
ncbi:MAG: hypothetical protein WC437_04760 [Patescibacteria group bacterium]